MTLLRTLQCNQVRCRTIHQTARWTLQRWRWSHTWPSRQPQWCLALLHRQIHSSTHNSDSSNSSNSNNSSSWQRSISRRLPWRSSRRCSWRRRGQRVSSRRCCQGLRGRRGIGQTAPATSGARARALGRASCRQSRRPAARSGGHARLPLGTATALRGQA